MSLKAINDTAGPFGVRLRKIVDAVRTDANRYEAGASLLREMLAAHALSGGTCPDDAANQGRVNALAASVPVPSDAEIDAAGGALLDAADRANVKLVVRSVAVIEYVLGKASAALPANDV